MNAMTNENFHNICRMVEQKTGVHLGNDRTPERRRPARLIPVLAALMLLSTLGALVYQLAYLF